MIGLFDSGSGGLTILQALHKSFPNQDFIYLGDHANAPYGHRSNEQIVDFTRRGVNYLMGEGCSLVILACNTAAAIALRTLQQNWLPDAYPDRRILGVLVPMVEAVTGVPWSQDTPNGHVGPTRTIALFATPKTITSGAFREEVYKRAPDIRLIEKACPGLVDAIEGHAGKRPITGLVNGFVQDLIESDQVNGTPIDTAILGCTHFPIVEDIFKASLGDGTRLYSQGRIVCDALQDYRTRHPHLFKKGSGEVTYLTTGEPKNGHLGQLKAEFKTVSIG